MTRKLHGFSGWFILAIVIGAMSWGTSLLAQNAPSAQDQQPQSQPSQAPDSAGQPSSSQSQSTPDQTAPAQSTPPDQSAPGQAAPPSRQSADPQSATTAGQTFTGTVVKTGNKYVLQDAASGTTYDIDHQDEVAKFEGKKVRVHGTLDASGKMIHVQ